MALRYADTITPSFGIPFPSDRLKFVQGEMQCSLTPEQQEMLTDQEVADLVSLINEQPAAERINPLDWMFVTPSWQKCNGLWPDAKVQVIFGGHRSMKTSYASALNMDIMRKIPGALTYSLQTNEERSNLINQLYLYSRLPKALKEKPGKHGMTYTQKNGFTGNACILPPEPGHDTGSACYFKNYSQYHNDPQSFEGLRGHLIHADEEIPFKLFETLFGRLGDYHGRMILTFTTLQNYTPVVSDLMTGAETLEERYAPDIGKSLPILQKCKNWPDTYIHYWWTEDNPFIDAQEIVRSYANRPLNDRLARLHGMPTKSASNQFPKFSRAVNVVPHNQIPFIKDPSTPVTIYHSVDPGDGKPWVMCWVGITEGNDVYIFRDFPDHATFGEWATPHQNAVGQPIGKGGPAQKKLSYGFQTWKDTILEIESEWGKEPAMRWMDPYFSKRGNTNRDGQTNLLEEMAAVDMHFTPAITDGNGVVVGCIKINELLEYDDTKPLSETNRPKLYISDRCENTIQSFSEYTGVTPTEHWKDFVDASRYVIVSGSEFLGDGIVEVSGGGAY